MQKTSRLSGFYRLSIEERIERVAHWAELTSEERGTLRFDSWWLDERYRYNMVPFRPAHMSAGDLEKGCLAARRAFYAWPSILRRARMRVNRSNPYMLANFLAINAMHQRDVQGRDWPWQTKRWAVGQQTTD